MKDFKLISNDKMTFDPSLNNVISEMFNELKKDDELIHHLKELGIDSDALIKANVSTITKYKNDRDYCKKCPGFEMCNKNHPHYIYELAYDGRMVTNELRACEYKLQDEKVNESYAVRDFPNEWRNSTIPNMDKSNVRKNLLMRYKKALNNNGANWLYITGSHRSGKSYVSATLINNYIETYKSRAAFINYPIRVRELVDLSYSNKDDFFKILNLYSSIDCLVIDDFGNEYKSEYIRDSITLAILLQRARLGLLTIFTSGFSYDDIADMYAINVSGKARAKQIKKLLEECADTPIDISAVSIY